MSDKRNAATVLAESVATDSRVELFHDADEDAWARVEFRPGIFDHWRIESRHFKRWIVWASYDHSGNVPSEGTLTNALRALDGMARNEGELWPVHLRVAHIDGTTYLDLCDAERNVVAVTPEGWRVVEGAPPVRFARTHGMRPLPVPKPTTERPAKLLSKFVNVEPESLVIITTLVTNWLSGIGPFAILELIGEQGSGKTLTARVLRDVVDPSKADVRSLPTEERDLIVSAENSYVLTYGNVSEVPAWLSDAFCRIVSGAGFSKRELYTNREEIIMSARRPIIIEGIPDVATSPDLADRTVPLVLQPIKTYIAESKFWSEFERVQPELLGSLLNAVAVGLRELPKVAAKSDYRMADFARWAEAVEPAVGKGFLKAYREQRAESAVAALEDCIFAEQLTDAVLNAGGELHEEPSKLLDAVEARLPEGLSKPKDWPKSARAFSEQLRRVSPALRVEGYGVEHHRSNGRRSVRVWSMSAEELRGVTQVTQVTQEDEEEGVTQG